MSTPVSSNDTGQAVVHAAPPHLKKLQKSHHVDVVTVKTRPTKKYASEVKDIEREYAPAKSEESLVKEKISRSKSDDAAAAAVAATGPSSEMKLVNEASRSLNLIEEVSGRERMKRHRVEVAGRVWIPEIWGQEELLKDWTDCSGFEASLMNSTVMSARAALIEEVRRANSGSLRMERSC